MLKVEITVEGLGLETEIGEDFCRYKIYFRASLCTELITAKLQNRCNLTETDVEPHTKVGSAMAQLSVGLFYVN